MTDTNTATTELTAPTEQSEGQQEQEGQPKEQGQGQEQESKEQEAPTGYNSLLSTMTQAQIDAIPDPELKAQVQALFNANKQLAVRAKEKDPTWRELGKYGKGVAGIKLSDNGAIQITGTRKAFGGLYIFSKEMALILEHQAEIINFILENRDLINQRTAAAEVARAKEKAENKNKNKN